MVRIACLALVVGIGAFESIRAADPPHFAAPAGLEPARVVPGGVTVLPNGRFLTPLGRRLYGGENLWRVAVRPDGKVVVGVCENGFVLYPQPTGKPSLVRRREYMPGGVFTRDGKRFVVSSGDAGHGIEVFDSTDWHKPVGDASKPGWEPRDQQPITAISVHKEAYVNDLVLSADERTCFGVDVARQRLVIFDLVANKVVADVPAGRQPYALALSPKGDRLFVANIGLFDYSLVPPPKPGEGDPRGLKVPAFGFPSREAEVGVDREGRKVPGLGDPYVPDSQSVFAYDVADPAKPKLLTKAKTGVLLHGPADRGKSVGGSAPNALLCRDGVLYVSNANNDTVQIFDAESLKPLRSIKLVANAELATLRGVIPTGLYLTKDGSRLLVCESGLNSIAVLDPKTGVFLGRLPAGWFPVQMAASPDESMIYVATTKGIGRGPRGELHRRRAGDERFGFPDFPGMFAVVPMTEFADAAKLAAGMQAVAQNNGYANAAPARKLPPEIEYVVFVTKENHTFDGIFGGLPGAKGVAEYAEFGDRGWIREKGRAERVPIMPNHVKLAREFAISDNFYMEPEASGDGHRWLVGVYPSLWTTRVFYAGWNFARTETARGRLVSMGSNGSQIPEDYLENGSLWEHLGRGGIPFRNYGEGFEFPDNDEGPNVNRSGAFTQVNYPMPKILFDNTCFEFPPYNNNIPDVARVDWFVEDVEKYRKAHAGKLPRFVNIAMCNDHGAKPNAKRGLPYLASYMADNDLALGRLVEYLSSQPEWPKMAILVTQDDSGGDADSVDRHRSFVLCISPYAKRGYVSHEHTSIMSILKTIYRLFGLGPNNQFDALATDLADMFQPVPDARPYVHVPADPRVFVAAKTFDPADPKFERRRKEAKGVAMDNPKFVETLYRTRVTNESEKKSGDVSR